MYVRFHKKLLCMTQLIRSHAGVRGLENGLETEGVHESSQRQYMLQKFAK